MEFNDYIVQNNRTFKNNAWLGGSVYSYKKSCIVRSLAYNILFQMKDHYVQMQIKCNCAYGFINNNVIVYPYCFIYAKTCLLLRSRTKYYRNNKDTMTGSPQYRVFKKNDKILKCFLLYILLIFWKFKPNAITSTLNMCFFGK